MCPACRERGLSGAPRKRTKAAHSDSAMSAAGAKSPASSVLDAGFAVGAAVLTGAAVKIRQTIVSSLPARLVSRSARNAFRKYFTTSFIKVEVPRGCFSAGFVL